MAENYTIQFTRSKEEAKRVYFNRDFKKSIRMQIVRIILLLPGFAISSFFFTIALEVALDLKDNKFITYLFTLLFCLIFLSPFIKSIIQMYRITRNHLNEMYKSKQIITTVCNFDDLNFRYKNDFFDYITTWENIKNLKIDDMYVKFQTKLPSVLFILPKEKISDELLNHIKRNLNNTK